MNKVDHFAEVAIRHWQRREAQWLTKAADCAPTCANGASAYDMTNLASHARKMQHSSLHHDKAPAASSH